MNTSTASVESNSEASAAKSRKIKWVPPRALLAVVGIIVLSSMVWIPYLMQRAGWDIGPLLR